MTDVLKMLKTHNFNKATYLTFDAWKIFVLGALTELQTATISNKSDGTKCGALKDSEGESFSYDFCYRTDLLAKGAVQKHQYIPYTL